MPSLFNNLLAAIFFFLVSPPVSVTPPPSERQSTTRKRRCPACQVSHDKHTFGPPGKHCQGPPSPSSEEVNHSQQQQQQQTSTIFATSEENPRRTNSIPADQVAQFRQHLQFLENQEQELVRSIQQEEESLLLEIRQKSERIKSLKASRTSALSAAPSSSNPINNAEENPTLPSAILDFPVVPATDNISTLLQRPFPHTQQQQSVPSQAAPAASLQPSTFHSNLPLSSSTVHPISENELFLRPTRTTDVTRGKVLRIVDFVSCLRPAEEEKVLFYDEN